VSKRPRYQGSIETHKKLLNYGRAMLKELAKSSRIQNTASPVMFHPDLHKRNIFVSEEDPTVVSAIIDWQSTSIEPTFWYADAIPDFAQPISDPADEDKIEPKSEACAKAYDYCIQFLAPKLSAARSTDEAYLRLFRYCYRTWEDGAVAFHEELIQTSQQWTELGFALLSPFPLPCPDDIAVHQKEYKRFEAAQQLRHSLSSLLNTASDGWVPPEDWEGTESAHREVFEGMLQEVLGNEQPDDDEPIRGENDLREIWPFDLKE
jgi:Ser/Thr protein kinase RdoA (MazF antagonist)